MVADMGLITLYEPAINSLVEAEYCLSLFTQHFTPIVLANQRNQYCCGPWARRAPVVHLDRYLGRRFLLAARRLARQVPEVQDHDFWLR